MRPTGRASHTTFSKPSLRLPEITHGLHLTEPGSDLWRERLAFRDALLADPALVAEYAAWKAQHAAGTGADDPYTDDKRTLVLRVLAGAGIELKPDEARLMPEALRAKRRGS